MSIWSLVGRELHQIFGRSHIDFWVQGLFLYCSSHLHQLKRTIDGNFKTGNYDKKNDANDVSLFGGRAYMPSEQRYQHYLTTVPQLQKEVRVPACILYILPIHRSENHLQSSQRGQRSQSGKVQEPANHRKH